jgi:hypothetical protein
MKFAKFMRAGWWSANEAAATFRPELLEFYAVGATA